MTAPASWLAELRRLFDAAFDDTWPAHLDELNDCYRLSGDNKLSTHVPESPLWFIGDVEAIQPNAWVLAISLNPHTPKPPDTYDIGDTPDFYWNLWRTHNCVPEYWKKTQVYKRLARVAAGALGEDLPGGQEQVFASNQMVFTNLCPYASGRFAFRPDQVAGLVARDRGFKTMARINRLLIEQAQPALVLVNGVHSMDAMESVYSGKLNWSEHRYRSDDKPTKCLRHRQGVLDLGAAAVPVVGFPFLGGFNHNANKEIDQLIRSIRAGISR
jgi:hypothetical protein